MKFEWSIQCNLVCRQWCHYSTILGVTGPSDQISPLPTSNQISTTPSPLKHVDPRLKAPTQLASHSDPSQLQAAHQSALQGARSTVRQGATNLTYPRKRKRPPKLPTTHRTREVVWSPLSGARGGWHITQIRGCGRGKNKYI